MNRRPLVFLFRSLLPVLLLCLLACVAWGASRKRVLRAAPAHKAPLAAHRVALVKAAAQIKKSPSPQTPAKKDNVQPPVIAGGPWTEPTYADSTAGDHVDGEDLNVRRAAVEALGPYNGSVVAVDPATGRILTMVDRKSVV